MAIGMILVKEAESNQLDIKVTKALNILGSAYYEME